MSGNESTTFKHWWELGEVLGKLETQMKDVQEAVSTLIKDKLDEDDMFAMPSEEARKRAVWKSELEKLHG